MTDNEIIKALECIASKEDVLCKNCSYNKYHLTECHRQAVKDALDLINRQQAEIERLLTELDLAKAFYKEKEAEFSLLNYKYNKTLNQLNDYQSIAKAEAIKEVESRLIERFKQLEHAPKTKRKTLRIEEVNSIVNTVLQVSVPNIINKVVKEMVGEE